MIIDETDEPQEKDWDLHNKIEKESAVPLNPDGSERECVHCHKIIYDAREKLCPDPDCGKPWRVKTGEEKNEANRQH